MDLVLMEVNVTLGFCGAYIESFLIDSVTPVFNTLETNWASKLVTVRKAMVCSYQIPYDHVVLAFLFHPLVTLTSIKLSLFKCLQWGIGASNISVYAEATYDYPNFYNEDPDIIPIAQYQDVQSSCDDLVSVTIPKETDTQYRIAVLWCPLSLRQPSIGCMWVKYSSLILLHQTLPQPTLK